MRNICIFHLLCFVLSFPLYAQNACTEEGVEVSIADITWDATATDLEYIMDTPFYGEMPSGTFHVVQLDFVPSADFQQNGYTFDFDLSILKSNKPVVLLFPTEISYGAVMDTPPFIVYPMLDVNMVITGFYVERLSTATMGGVATSAGLMVRESTFGSLCIDISLENRLSTLLNNTTCQLPDEVVRECRARTLSPIIIFPIQIGKREAQSSRNRVNVYPIPAQNNVFIDANDLEINNIQIIDIQGKTQQHQASARYGTDRIQINTSQLESGVYWLKMEASDSVICRKIIVQR